MLPRLGLVCGELVCRLLVPDAPLSSPGLGSGATLPLAASFVLLRFAVCSYVCRGPCNICCFRCFCCSCGFPTARPPYLRHCRLPRFGVPLHHLAFLLFVERLIIRIATCLPSAPAGSLVRAGATANNCCNAPVWPNRWQQMPSIHASPSPQGATVPGFPPRARARSPIRVRHRNTFGCRAFAVRPNWQIRNGGIFSAGKPDAVDI